MKNGLYAIYNGREYEAGVKEDGSITLRSNDSNDLKNGFTLYKNIIYIKRVKSNGVESIYSAITYADYNGCKCQVIKEIDDKLLLNAILGDYKIFVSLGFDMVDRGVYNKWVNAKDVESVYEIREAISL